MINIHNLWFQKVYMWKRGSGGWEGAGGRSHRKKRKPIIVSKNMYLAETTGMHVASDSSGTIEIRCHRH